MNIYLHKLDLIHKKISLIHGNINEEYVEQTLSCKYIKKNNIVLEIGGNLGRNALIISELLEDQSNLLILEPNHEFYLKLLENRNHNSKHFNVDNCALSNYPLYSIGSVTFKENNISENFPLSGKDYNQDNKKIVITKTYQNIVNEYKNFDTLCIDCEGAFYYILQEMEYILDNIKLIIMENDYKNENHYIFVKDILEKRNFKCIESIPLNGCPWDAPCKDYFYQVWIKS